MKEEIKDFLEYCKCMWLVGVLLLLWVSGMIYLILCSNTVHYTAPAEQAPHVINATVTAYTSSIEETDDNPWETASGTRPKAGTIACPAKLPFGTVVEIEGKRFTCEDRMNSRYRESDHYDVWLGSKEEAMNWGKKELAVLIHE